MCQASGLNAFLSFSRCLETLCVPGSALGVGHHRQTLFSWSWWSLVGETDINKWLTSEHITPADDVYLHRESSQRCEVPEGGMREDFFEKVTFVKWWLKHETSFLGHWGGGGSAVIRYRFYSSQQLQEVVMIDFHSMVWRNWGSDCKFPQLASGRARISTHLNPSSHPLITRLCYLAHNRHSDNHWGNTVL